MLMRIIAPSGRCPFQLEGTDQDSVAKWVNKIKESDPGTNYSFEAYRYWIRHTYDINGTEYKLAANSLSEIMTGVL